MRTPRTREVRSGEERSDELRRRAHLNSLLPTSPSSLISQQTRLSSRLASLTAAIGLLERRANVEKNGFVDINDEEKHWTFDENEKSLEESSILQAAVIKVVVGNMREGWWSYKIVGLCERTLLAIVVLCTKYVKPPQDEDGISSHDQWGVSRCKEDVEFENYGIDPVHSAWTVLAIVFTGLVVTMFTRPYWDAWEDIADIVSRLCVVILAAFGALLMSCVVDPEVPWLVVAINITGFTTLCILIIAIGPVRVVINTYIYQMKQYRCVRASREATEESAFTGHRCMLLLPTLPSPATWRPFAAATADAWQRYRRCRLL